MTELKHVDIYTRGTYSGRSGKGGWGAILKYKNIIKEISGFESKSESKITTNKMQLTAIVAALQKLKYPCDVTVHTNSMYISEVFTNGWFDNWKSNNWSRANRQPIKNKELWEALERLMNIHNVALVWTENDELHPENERCDKLVAETVKNAA